MSDLTARTVSNAFIKVTDPGPSNPNFCGRRSVSELKRILSDPHAVEEDWLSASYELEQYENQKNDFNAARNLRNRRSRSRLLAMAACCCTGAGFYFWISHATPAVTPAAQPSIAPAEAPAVAKGDIDYGRYMADLQRKIKRNWYPPKSSQSKHIKVRFKVHEDGSISDLHFKPYQKVDEGDAYARAATEAVTNCGKFDPLPPGSPENVDVEFTFDYKLFQRNGHSY